MVSACATTPEPVVEQLEKPVVEQPETTTVQRCHLAIYVDTESEHPVSQRPGLDCVETVAYYETIEQSPNVQSVTRVTNFEDHRGHVGGAAMSDNGDLYYHFVEDLTAERPRANIWSTPMLGGGRTRVTSGPGLDTYPTFAPRSNNMFFSSDRVGGRNSIWRIGISGGTGLTRVTNTSAVDFFPSLSPDEAWSTFESWIPNSRRPQVWVIDHITGLLTQLREGRRPRVSPDGTRILFSRRNGGTGRSEIWVMDVYGGDETLLTSGGFHDETEPSWSPDGRWIVYASNEGIDRIGQSNYDIWALSLERGTRTQLTTNGSYDDEPLWHSDGRIFFRSNRGGSWNIWAIQTVGVGP